MKVGRCGLGITIIAVMSAMLTGAADARSVMQAGGWKNLMKVYAKSNETGEYVMIKELTSTVCLSPEFLANDPYLTPAVDQRKAKQKRAKCTISGIDRKAESSSWNITCTTVDNSLIETSVKNVVSPTSMTSESISSIRKKGDVSFVKTVTEGLFIGACTGDMMRR